MTQATAEAFSDYTVPTVDREDEAEDNWNHGYGQEAAEPEDTGHGTADDDGADSESGTGAKGRTGQKNNRPLIRKTALKAVEIHQSTELRRELAAALLGCSADTADLAVAVMTAGRSAGGALADLGEIRAAAEENPMMAGVLVLSLGKARLKAVWTVLHTLGAVGKQMNASETKAAMDAGSAIAGLTPEQLAELDAAGELVKRS